MDKKTIIKLVGGIIIVVASYFGYKVTIEEILADNTTTVVQPAQ